jgi:hypothetical protein
MPSPPDTAIAKSVAGQSVDINKAVLQGPDGMLGNVHGGASKISIP